MLVPLGMALMAVILKELMLARTEAEMFPRGMAQILSPPSFAWSVTANSCKPVEWSRIV